MMARRKFDAGAPAPAARYNGAARPENAAASADNVRSFRGAALICVLFMNNLHVFAILTGAVAAMSEAAPLPRWQCPETRAR